MSEPLTLPVDVSVGTDTSLAPSLSDPGPPVRFLHSADWQLGMMRHFLGPEAQARFGQARVDAIERIGELATARDAAFVVVAGDVFDANQVDRQVVLRACEALRALRCGVYLLPGNHDALEPGSVWTSAELRHHLPSHVEVLDSTTPRVPCPGVEVVGVPWRTRRPVADPVLSELDLEPTPADVVRVLVGHGQLDTLTPEADGPPLVRLADLERELARGAVDYVALGDRHSRTNLGDSGRIWYAGAPEPTRPEEERPGEVLQVDLDGGGCEVTPLQIGTWRLLSEVVEVDADADLDALESWLAEQPDKARTVVRLGVRGTLSAAGVTRLELLLDAQAELFAAIQRWRRHWEVALRPDDDALDALPVTGAARTTLEELRAATREGDAEAGDAVALLHRLVGGAA